MVGFPRSKKRISSGEIFSFPSNAPPMPPLTLRAKAARELGVLPFSPTAHPMALLRDDLPFEVIPSDRLPEHVGKEVEVAGLLAAFREVPQAGGALMAFVSLQDERGWAEAVFFPPAYQKVAPRLNGIGPYLLRGVVKERFGVLHLEGRDLKRFTRKHLKPEETS